MNNPIPTAMANIIQTRNADRTNGKVEIEATSIFDKILLTDIPRSVFFIKGKIHSCPVGGRLESRYFDRGDTCFIGTYDNRATVNMIIEDLHSARQGASH
jgi:hypothetical protein